MFLFFPLFGQVQTDRLQTESDAYEPTVQVAQVGSNITGVYSNCILKKKNQRPRELTENILKTPTPPLYLPLR